MVCRDSERLVQQQAEQAQIAAHLGLSCDSGGGHGGEALAGRGCARRTACKDSGKRWSGGVQRARKSTLEHPRQSNK